MNPTFREQLVIGNDLVWLSKVRDLVRRGVEQGNFPLDQLNRLQIAVDEAVTNIIEHGYADKPRDVAAIDITLAVDAHCFRIDIVDHGERFPVDELADVDIAAHVAAGRSGGLGVFLMRRIMDQVDYHFRAGQPNRLTMIKRR
jgi:anti-sigma regulatory factor (Ser/Thr protein kinase)